jgi:hypothetical protein
VLTSAPQQPIIDYVEAALVEQVQPVTIIHEENILSQMFVLKCTSLLQLTLLSDHEYVRSATLFVLDTQVPTWRVRGLGDIEILVHQETKSARVVIEAYDSDSPLISNPSLSLPISSSTRR